MKAGHSGERQMETSPDQRAFRRFLEWLDEGAALQTTFVVGYDLVYRHRGVPDGGRNLFPRPGLVLGVALGDSCRLKIWESCPTKSG